MRTLIVCLTVAALGTVAGLRYAQAEDDAKPKYTIKQVMKEAHKDGLLKKVLGGDASDAEKEKLCELYVALAANKCPKGDAADWKEKTETIVKACKAGDNAALKTATNCGACHKEHKGK